MKALERIPTGTVVILLTVVALAVRVLHLNSTDIAGDEPFSVFVAQFGLSKIIAYLSTGNNPPLFEVLLHIYVNWFGDSDFNLRLLPAVFSAFTVIPVFLAGKRFFNTRVALMASLLFLFSIYQIRFAHEIRVYSFFSLVTAWTFYFFLSIVERPSSLRIWAAIVLCNVLLMYAHFTSFYILLTQFVCGIFFIPKRQWKYLFGSLALSGLFFSPYLLVFITRLDDVKSGGTWVVPPGLGELYGSINLMLNQRLTTLAVIATTALGLVLSRKTGILKIIKQMLSEPRVLAVFMWFFLPYSLMFLCSILFVPMFIDRYILYTSIPLFLSVAVLVDQAWCKAQWPIIGVLLIAFGSIATTNLNPPNNREIASAVQFVKNLKTENTEVYLCPDHYDLVFAFHFNRDWFNEMARDEGDPFQALNAHLNKNEIYPIRNKYEMLLRKGKRIIYLDADSKFVLPDNQILENIQQELNLTESAHFEQIFDVYVFDAGRIQEEKSQSNINE